MQLYTGIEHPLKQDTSSQLVYYILLNQFLPEISYDTIESYNIRTLMNMALTMSFVHMIYIYIYVYQIICIYMHIACVRVYVD